MFLIETYRSTRDAIQFAMAQALHEHVEICLPALSQTTYDALLVPETVLQRAEDAISLLCEAVLGVSREMLAGQHYPEELSSLLLSSLMSADMMCAIAHTAGLLRQGHVPATLRQRQIIKYVVLNLLHAIHSELGGESFQNWVHSELGVMVRAAVEAYTKLLICPGSPATSEPCASEGVFCTTEIIKTLLEDDGLPISVETRNLAQSVHRQHLLTPASSSPLSFEDHQPFTPDITFSFGSSSSLASPTYLETPLDHALAQGSPMTPELSPVEAFSRKRKLRLSDNIDGELTHLSLGSMGLEASTPKHRRLNSSRASAPPIFAKGSGPFLTPKRRILSSRNDEAMDLFGPDGA